MEEKKRICCKCNLELEPMNAVLTYLGYHFNITLPRCPSCGQVYTSEEIVRGRMVEVEKQLEDK